MRDDLVAMCAMWFGTLCSLGAVLVETHVDPPQSRIVLGLVVATHILCVFLFGSAAVASTKSFINRRKNSNEPVP